MEPHPNDWKVRQREYLKKHGLTLLKTEDLERLKEKKNNLEQEVRDLERKCGNFEMAAQGFKDRLQKSEREIELSDKIIAERNRILDAHPCPVHGHCVPYVLEKLAKEDALVTEQRFVSSAKALGIDLEWVIRSMDPVYQDGDEKMDDATDNEQIGRIQRALDYTRTAVTNVEGPWRPIDTAPKDEWVLIGGYVGDDWTVGMSILFEDHGAPMEGEPYSGWIWAVDYIEIEEPLVWMPLPGVPHNHVQEPQEPELCPVCDGEFTDGPEGRFCRPCSNHIGGT